LAEDAAAELAALILDILTDLTISIPTPSSCQPKCVSRGRAARRKSAIDANRSAAVKMSFIQRRALSTLIPPKVRLHAHRPLRQQY
jgi:hypothetical protein